MIFDSYSSLHFQKLFTQVCDANLAHYYYKKAVLSQGHRAMLQLFVRFKVADNIHYKFKRSLSVLMVLIKQR